MNESWALEICPESDGDFHDPRAVRLHEEAVEAQVEVEIDVICRRCGASGLASMVLSLEGIVGHSARESTESEARDV